MASQLGPKWLNRVQQIATPTHAGRLSRYALLAEQVNLLEAGLEKETDADLLARSKALRLRARQGDSLNSLLPEAFALVRESAKRTIKQRHYDVQLVGGASVSLAAALGLRFASAASATKASLALDWYPNADHAGLMLAQARGYFAAAGLDLNIYTPSDATTVLQTVGAGKDDFGISYQTDVLLARAAGVPVVSIAALVQHPLIVVMSSADRNIKRPRDLIGKAVGYPGIASQEAFLATMLENDGGTLSDVELVNVDFNLIPAVLSGQVDAVMGAFRNVEVIIAEQDGHPVNAMPVEAWGVPDYYELVLVASEATIAKRPDQVTAFLAAVQHGFADAIADPAAALDALVAASPEIDKTVTEKGIAILLPDWQGASPAFGVQTAERWAAYAAWMKSRSLIPAELDASRAFTTNLLPIPTGTPVATPAQ